MDPDPGGLLLYGPMRIRIRNTALNQSNKLSFTHVFFLTRDMVPVHVVGKKDYTDYEKSGKHFLNYSTVPWYRRRFFTVQF